MSGACYVLAYVCIMSGACYVLAYVKMYTCCFFLGVLNASLQCII